MGLLNNITKIFKVQPVKHKRISFFTNSQSYIDFVFDKRGYAAAKQDRLLSDWQRSTESANKEVKNGIRIVRDRARDLFNNNDYAKKYVELCVQNIVGPNGVMLQNKAKENNKLDKRANDLIEAAWKEWSKKEFCTVTGKLAFTEAKKMVLKHVARDGEIFVRKIKVNRKENKYGFALQLIEPDHVDERLWQDDMKEGHYIRMGIEFDKWGKPVYYYVKNRPEKEYEMNGTNKSSDYMKVPANEIIHVQKPDRADQARSVSWLVQSMIRLQMLNGYEEAALINARVSAAKMGFFTSETDNAAEYVGDDVDSDNNITMQVEPGKMEQLPPGIKFESWQPEYPTAQHNDFVKRTLEGIASGLGVSYASLSSDLEGVNYSSIRAGLVEEREQWKSLQNWFIENFVNPVYESWLEMALTTSAINLPISKYDKFNAPNWMPKRWSWVDPLKDIQAIEKAIQLKLRTRREAMAETNNDFEETIDALAEEKQYIIDKGLEQDFNDNNADDNADLEDDNNDGEEDGNDE